MKSKIFNFVTVSLATAILLVPAQKAFGFGAAPQTNLEQTQHLVHDVESRLTAKSAGTHAQELVQESKATQTGQMHPTHPVAEAYQNSDSSQPRSAEQINQVSNTVGGLFVTVLFISYILVGLQYRKHRAHRAAILLQQIETLERIWKMKPQQR